MEKKTNLLNFAAGAGNDSKNASKNESGLQEKRGINSSRGQMIHKTSRVTEKETLVELELTEDGRRI